MRQKKHKGGVKYDQGKTRFSILQGKAIGLVKKVGEMGAVKYGDFNYKKGMPVLKYIDAAYRHIYDEWLFEGNDYDSCKPTCKKPCTTHSGLNHLAHGAWNILSALEQMIEMPELDNRYSTRNRRKKKRK